MIWLTADHHLGHDNIRGFTNRPFGTVEEMDANLIQAWNSVVKPDGIVYHLGDFCLGNWDMAKGYFARLQGDIGVLEYTDHHDSRWLKGMRSDDDDWRIHLLPPLVTLNLQSTYLTLCHFPLEVWNRKHYGAMHVHGHSHGVLDASRTQAILDVGVDNAYRLLGEYRPFSLEEVFAIIRERESPRD